MPGQAELKPRITVFGVGGAGGNAVNNMIEKQLDGVEFVVANTDAQALQQAKSDNRVQLGVKVTEGLGAGARASVGAMAAEESIEEIVDHLAGAHMCFITAGMGGGTGTGAAPIIAQAARELGVLTVGVVTKPFQFEGAKRMRQAEDGVEALQKVVDTLIIIPNQNLFRLANEKTTFTEAFAMADRVVIMSDGVIEQVGSAREIYRAPASRFVAEFVGRNNIVSGTVKSGRIETALGVFPAEAPDGKAAMVISADLVTASRAATEGSVPATIISEEFVGSVVTLFLEAADGSEFKVQVQERALADLDIHTGGTLHLSWDPASVHILSEAP